MSNTKPKGTFKTLCSINTALGGSNEGCVGNKDVLDRIAIALGASSSAKTNYITDAMQLVAENIDDESPESIAAQQVELAQLRNDVIAAKSAFDSLITRDFTSVALSDTTAVGPYAFAGCASLTSVNLPAVTTIGSYAFLECTSLTSIDLPVATTIESSAFNKCSSLTSVDLPAVTTIGFGAFGVCSSLAEVSLPVAASIGRQAFISCGFSVIDLPAVTFIGDMAFAQCANLTEVTMDVTSVPTLSATTAFYMTASTLTFYVRESMISAFQEATNWSAFSSQFSAIPEEAV